MATLDLKQIVELSRSALEQFERAEPKPWDRDTLLVELIGEMGSLAHQVQHWDGFKHGNPNPAAIADECADVMFVCLRLAQAGHLALPAQLEVEPPTATRASTLLLQLATAVADLISSGGEDVSLLVATLRKLGTLAELLKCDLVTAHSREMQIANQFFAASGKSYPRLSYFRHPLACLRLWRLVKEKRHWR